jgi:hypothetical protein
VLSKSASSEPKSSNICTVSQMSKPVPMSHGRRRASSPRKAIPGKRLVRTASSVNASTTALFDRRVLRASLATILSVDAVKRTLNGSPLRSRSSVRGDTVKG